MLFSQSVNLISDLFTCLVPATTAVIQAAIPYIKVASVIELVDGFQSGPPRGQVLGGCSSRSPCRSRQRIQNVYFEEI